MPKISNQKHQYPLLQELCYTKFLELDTESEAEGLFNKWDLKTHQIIASNLQQSKIQLASLPLNEIGCNSLELIDFRTKKHQ
ncbi:hypothetical protein C2G38_2225775 [Gigaspora rosea]|uniref:Uncharacterized protein n=1 Tax=Gigaspora rosea TaxID=44941 RepID=A0A397U7A0_9GLOM|nr:hypothetical protein C2G38_2225775 [Gigaspora rosea]